MPLFSCANGVNTPFRSPYASPFCTSPSQLQELTLDGNETCEALGINSPGGGQPLRGRSVKEYEEQMNNLKKENFNLKLRIYFLEERMGRGPMQDKEGILKKNIELEVEMESLRKDLQSKQELLCQAVKAMELEDEEFKKLLKKKDDQIKEMAATIDDLRLSVEALTKANQELVLERSGINSMKDSIAMYTEAFGLKETGASEYEDQQQQEAEHWRVRCHNLEIELADKDAKLKAMMLELEQIGQNVSNNNHRIRTLADELDAKGNEIEIKNQKLAQKDEIIQDKVAEIEELRSLLDEGQFCCAEEQKQAETLKSKIMARNNTIADLESKLEQYKTNIRNLEASLNSAFHEVNRLQAELKVRSKPRSNSTSPQSIPDTTSRTKLSPRSLFADHMEGPSNDMEHMKRLLNERGAEIEKYHDEKKKTHKVISDLFKVTENLRKELDVKAKQIELMESQRTVEEHSATSKISAELNSDAELSAEIEALSNTNDNYKQIITDLQEQLEGFIQDNQVKDNRILELEHDLAALETRFTRNIEDKAKKLQLLEQKVSEFAPSQSGDHCEDGGLRHKLALCTRCKDGDPKWLLLKEELDVLRSEKKGFDKQMDEMTGVCSLLTTRLEELAVFLSSLLKERLVSSHLRSKQRTRIQKLVNSSLDLSKTLSMRLSLDPDHSLLELSALANYLNNTSASLEGLERTDDHGDGRPEDLGVSPISSLKKTPSKSRNRLEEQTDSEAWSEPDKDVSFARMGLRDDSVAKEAAAASSEDDAARPASRTPSKRSHDVMSGLQERIDEVEAKLVQKDEEISRLRLELAELSSRSEAERLELEAMQKKLKSAEDATRSSEDKYMEALEKLRSVQLQAAEEFDRSEREKAELMCRLENALVEIQEAELRFQVVTESEMALQQAETRSKAKLLAVEAERTELQSTLRRQVEELARVKVSLQTAEHQIRTSELAEAELHRRLDEDAAVVMQLRAEKENLAMAASNASLALTKLSNEKLRLEQRLREAELHESDLAKGRKEVEIRMEELRSELERSERDRSDLEVRISEMGMEQARLHNALVKTSCLDLRPQKLLLARQRSDLSEEDMGPEVKLWAAGEVRPTNPSPDLGIESDQGRFSSLETQKNGHSPKADESDGRESASGCRQKGKLEEVLSSVALDGKDSDAENRELRRKLLETKRLLRRAVRELSLANENKKELEKNVSQQVKKTFETLRMAKHNLESGSESDMCRK